MRPNGRRRRPSRARVAGAVAAVALLCGSCATMSGSGPQPVLVLPEFPAGVARRPVTVQVTGPGNAYRVEIPATLVHPPSSFTPVVIEVADPCFAAASYRLKTGITPAYWGNVLNVVGFGIDALTGAMWRYESVARVPVRPVADGAECPPPD